MTCLFSLLVFSEIFSLTQREQLCSFPLHSAMNVSVFLHGVSWSPVDRYRVCVYVLIYLPLRLTVFFWVAFCPSAWWSIFPCWKKAQLFWLSPSHHVNCNIRKVSTGANTTNITSSFWTRWDQIKQGWQDCHFHFVDYMKSDKAMHAS